MKVWVTTLAYLDLPVLEMALEQYAKTAVPVKGEYILLDHHWPLNYWKHRHRLLELAEKYNCRVMSPYENLGGHGGNNWLIQNLPVRNEDLIITYDADSNPQTVGWNAMLVKAMEDPSYAAISLTINADLLTKDWVTEETTSGVAVKRPRNGIEMMNITAFRASFLRLIGGFKGPRRFYGFVEGHLHQSMQAMGLKHGYLVDAYENLKPIEPHPQYQEWKRNHVTGTFPGNFDQWAKEKGLA
jgi:hypothetical protein